MKIITWNVNGIRACFKKGLVDFLMQEKPDVFCVQETKAHLDQVEDPVKTLGFRQSVWSSAVRKGYSGVATFTQASGVRQRRGLGIPKYDQEGRVVISSFEKFDLYNIYFPNGGSGPERQAFKMEFLKDLNAHLKNEISQGRSVIVVGDYNVAHREVDVYDPVRLSSISGFLPEEREWFDEFLDLGFVDTFRHFHPQEKNRYTWWSYQEMARYANRGWRIDYICVTKDLLPLLKEARIREDVEGSDHCPVVIELD